MASAVHNSSGDVKRNQHRAEGDAEFKFSFIQTDVVNMTQLMLVEAFMLRLYLQLNLEYLAVTLNDKPTNKLSRCGFNSKHVLSRYNLLQALYYYNKKTLKNIHPPL